VAAVESLLVVVVARGRDGNVEARSAKGIWRQPNRLSETPKILGRARDLAAPLVGLSRRPEPTWTTGLARKLSGRKFCSRKKGGDGLGKTKRGNGTKWMLVFDGQGIPLGSRLVSASPASPAELTLAESTLARGAVPRAGRGRPQPHALRVIADFGYNRNPVCWRLLQRGILLTCSHRRGLRKPSLNRGRSLRRYRKRWRIERTLAWLGNFRRLLVRYEHQIKMYRAFFHLACLIITLRHL